MEQLQQQLNDLKEEMDTLKKSTTITRDVEQAFYDRFKMSTFATLSLSSKSASSENQVVNEAGAATYSVLKPPDGFEKRIVNGIAHYYPFYL